MPTLRCLQNLVVQRLHAQLDQRDMMLLQKLQALSIYIIRARRQAHAADEAFGKQCVRQLQKLTLQLKRQAGKAAAVKGCLVRKRGAQPRAPACNLLLGACQRRTVLTADFLLIAKHALMRTACVRNKNR